MRSLSLVQPLPALVSCPASLSLSLSLSALRSWPRIPTGARLISGPRYLAATICERVGLASHTRKGLRFAAHRGPASCPVPAGLTLRRNKSAPFRLQASGGLPNCRSSRPRGIRGTLRRRATPSRPHSGERKAFHIGGQASEACRMSIHAPANNPRKLPQMRIHSLPFSMQASGDRPDCRSPRPQESEASSAGAQPRLAPHLSEARATLWSEASGGRLDCRTSRPRGIRASCAGALPRFVSRQGDEHIFCFQASGDRPGCRSPRPRGTSRILCRCATLFRLSPGRSKHVFVSKPAGTGLGAGPRVLSFGEQIPCSLAGQRGLAGVLLPCHRGLEGPGNQ